MNKLLAAVAPALLACVLALVCFLICARIFHVPPIGIKVAAIVIIATTTVAALVAGLTVLFRSRSE